ncbi:MAG: isopentenyl phosphate kinase [Halodesulfurarchaeum sp.]
MTVVLKLGGSLITEKDTRETVDRDALDRASDVIGSAGVRDLVLVHGGGSFGHPNAENHGIGRSEGTTDAASIRVVHDAMGRLQSAVIDSLDAASVPAVPVRPFSMGFRPTPAGVRLGTDPVEAMVAEGFVPVLHGDVFTTRGAGATVVSGDELVLALARQLDVDRVGFCGDVPGVYDDEGAVVPEIRSLPDVRDFLGSAATTDVTGGMEAKVRSILEAEIPANVFDLASLEAFLEGRDPGTTIRGG